jgi:hypothetical protein
MRVRALREIIEPQNWLANGLFPHLQTENRIEG